MKISPPSQSGYGTDRLMRHLIQSQVSTGGIPSLDTAASALLLSGLASQLNPQRRLVETIGA